MRVLHRDMPHLHTARGRTRQSARPYLSDQEYVGARYSGAGGDGQAFGPLSLLSLLYDYLPVRCPLYALGRSCARTCRKDLQTAADGKVDPAVAVVRFAASVDFPACADRGLLCEASRAVLAGNNGGNVSDGAEVGRAAESRRQAASVPRRRRTSRACRLDERLCAAGTSARDQRGDDPHPDASRYRSRCGSGGGLLWRAGSSHGSYGR